MTLSTAAGTAVMYREMLSYGITEDLQTSLTLPLGSGNTLMMAPRTRVGSMMGAFQDIEGSVLWRFHRTAPDVGERYESTLIAGVSDGQNAMREGLTVGQGLNFTAVTGYASRSVYWWLGGGLQHYLPHYNAQLGNLYYLSAVWGWRPEYFRHEYPAPDWRLFVEAWAKRRNAT